MIYGFDIETANPMSHASEPSPFNTDALLLTVALANGKKAKGYVLDHPLDFRTAPAQYARRIKKIQKILGNPDNILIGHNIVMFDVLWWEVMTGHKVKAKLFDTKIAWSLINENSPNTLEWLAGHFQLGIKNEDALRRSRLDTYAPWKVKKYNIQDAILSRALYEPVLAALREAGQEKMFYLQMREARALLHMSTVGVYSDLEFLQRNMEEIAEENRRTEARLREILSDGTKKGSEAWWYARNINFNSSNDLRELLYERMGLPAQRKSHRTGIASTDKKALQQLRNTAPVMATEFFDLLLKFRKTTKLLSTYLGPIKERHTKVDGRMHTTFNLGKSTMWGKASGTTTGRLSSTNPNLQNPPRDPRVRGIIAATPGWKLLNADYSQLEVRIAAWYAHEKMMLRAFAEGKDIHSLTLAVIKGIPYEEVIAHLNSPDEEERKHWKKQRSLVKPINFGIMYGASAYTIMTALWDEDIFIPIHEAQFLIDSWLDKYRRVDRLIQEWRTDILRDGQMTTPLGRVRHLFDPIDEEVDPNSKYGRHVIRQGVNFMVQSFASDLCLIALAALDKYCEDKEGIRPVLTVHDSILVEYDPRLWPEDRLNKVMNYFMVTLLKETLEEEFDITNPPPLKIDVDTNLDRWS